MTLRPINQAHIDYFVANVGTGNNALRAFVSWACANGHAFGIEVPINKRFSPAAAMSADGLWQAADRLLVDETVEMAARVAGLFILLYAQSLADCVRLRHSDVVLTDGRRPARVAYPCRQSVGRLRSPRLGTLPHARTNGPNRR